VYAIFDLVNERVTARLDRMPTVHEESLDLAFIDAVLEAQGPHLSPCGTVVDIDVHFIGGGHHWDRWEIADIGLIVTFRRANVLLRTKVVLLQSKRLYPRQSELADVEGLARSGGFGSLVRPSSFASNKPRTFRFDGSCRYKALQVGEPQWHAIRQYESRYGLPVHYMLYHPRTMPFEASIPVTIPVRQPAEPVRIGARVISAKRLRMRTANLPNGLAPSYSELTDEIGEVGIRLPDFVIDRVFACHEGYIADDVENDEGLQQVFYAREMPIAAAVRLDINLPD
jgi:hypothetical protein